jgi:hypothetical protein
VAVTGVHIEERIGFHPLFIEVLIETNAVGRLWRMATALISGFHPLFIEVLIETEADSRVFRLSRPGFGADYGLSPF